MTATDIGLAALIFVGGLGAFFGFFRALCAFLDWSCQRCLRREPDNPYCCE